MHLTARKTNSLLRKSDRSTLHGYLPTVITQELLCFGYPEKEEVHVHVFDQKRIGIGELNPHLP